MEAEIPGEARPSFSPWRRWTIGLNVVVIVVVVFAVVVMVNYLSREYSKRFYLSSRMQHELSPQTVKFLRAMTNHVKVVVYYDRNEPFYGTVVSLLNEYKRFNPRISIDTVDYLRDAGAAQKVKAQYKLTFPSATNMIIFDCEGKKSLPVDGNMLTRYVFEETPNEEAPYRKRPVEFNGERMFTSALLAVSSTNQPKAYFLEGHGEHPFNSADETYGYQNFSTIVAQQVVLPRPLRLVGTNTIPTDGLLIIAGPRQRFDPSEIARIDDYLTQGGRLLVLFNFYGADKETGLEKLLAKWGVEVGSEVIKDPDRTYSKSDIVVEITSKHPLVNALMTMQLQLIEPRAIGKLRIPNAPADAPLVEEVASSGPRAYPEAEPRRTGRYPLMVAVEKGAIKGVITERGAKRIVVAGDSFFLTNRQIGAAANGDFVNCAVNWLLARTELLDVGPHPIVNFRITMTVKQMQRAELVLVAGMPGAMLLLGGLVWLRRRK